MVRYFKKSLKLIFTMIKLSKEYLSPYLSTPRRLAIPLYLTTANVTVVLSIKLILYVEVNAPYKCRLKNNVSLRE